ncbi:MAG: pyrroloquinoline quinone biosynthesis protein PqqB [Gemmatimonas sp.]|nr:pyrroloquinoline quinone biosynthesis protein PqqB [Gemmatimonas sp.]
MQLQVLGSAAGGGFPQWNCGCRVCSAAREGDGQAYARRQSSISVRGSGGGWYLVNASPDVREQLEVLRAPAATALRSSPVVGVILTDAEIDHTAGLIILREASGPLNLYGTTEVRQALTIGYPVLKVLEGYCGVRWTALNPGGTLCLPNPESPSLKVEAFPVPADPPLYMRTVPPESGSVSDGLAVGLVFTDPTTGRRALYAPAVGVLDDAFLARLEGCDVALLDGTFWHNNELPDQGIGTRTALDMGHIPLSGRGGTIERLKEFHSVRKVLIHINNSNPILLEDSAERRTVEEAGFEVAHDGMVIDI